MRGVVRRDGYRIEKLTFASRPHHHVTAHLFLPDNPKYKVLFTDSFVSEYMLMNIYRRESKKMLPYIRKNYHVTEEEADKIFLFGVTGAFAVNRSMGWNKDQSWYRVQRVLLTFLEGGYEALRKL